MFYLATKKDLKKESSKVKSSFQRRDEKSSSHNKKTNEELKQLREKISSNETNLAYLKGVVDVLLKESKAVSQSHSQPVSTSSKRSLGNVETRMINKIRRTRKALMMAEIGKLLPSMSVVEAYDIIVLEKSLCSKASFYRYINDLRSQSLIKTETKVKLKKK